MELNEILFVILGMSANIHVVISPWDLSDDYNRHAGVTLLSLLEYSSQPITFHLLYDEKLCIGNEKKAEYNKTCYQKIADKYKCTLLFHHVELPEWSNEIKKLSIFTPGSLLRLNIPEILKDIDKIIYLDCDTVIRMDISKLWEINIDGKYLAATISGTWPKTVRKSILKRGISLSNYFNSGVLLLNLSELRKISFTKKAWEFLKNNLDSPMPDQDAMNYLCQDNFIKLDWRYNNIGHLNDENNNCIMHLCGTIKPWHAYTNPYSDDIYWEYLRKTPWCESEKVYNTYLRAAPDIKKALSTLEKDFFFYVQGSRWKKIQYACHFILRMLISMILGIKKKW